MEMVCDFAGNITHTKTIDGTVEQAVETMVRDGLWRWENHRP